MGLGIVLLAAGLSVLESGIRALLSYTGVEGASKQSVTGLIFGLGVCAGWWVFATPAPGSTRTGLNWAVRAATVVSAVYMVVGLLLPVRDASAAMTPGAVSAGLLSSGAWILLFYGSLVLVRRAGAMMGDAWVQRHAVVCMIVVPVLFLAAFAAMAIFVAMTMTSIAQSSLTDTSKPLPTLPTGGIMIAVLSVMIVCAVWYLGFLLRTWLRLMRWGQTSPALVAAC